MSKGSVQSVMMIDTVTMSGQWIKVISRKNIKFPVSTRYVLLNIQGYVLLCIHFLRSTAI